MNNLQSFDEFLNEGKSELVQMTGPGSRPYMGNYRRADKFWEKGNMSKGIFSWKDPFINKFYDKLEAELDKISKRDSNPHEVYVYTSTTHTTVPQKDGWILISGTFAKKTMTQDDYDKIMKITHAKYGYIDSVFGGFHKHYGGLDFMFEIQK